MIYRYTHSQGDSFRKTRKQRSSPEDLAASQEVIFRFFIENVRDIRPTTLLHYFKNLFIYNTQVEGIACAAALQKILFSNQQDVFLETLTRTCYILINNWESSRQQAAIPDLIDSFSDPILKRHAIEKMTLRLRTWVSVFVNSQDYKNLSLFAERFHQHKSTSVSEKIKTWSDRYSHYHLIQQAEGSDTSPEQREAARTLTRQVRQKFRLNLALYVAHNQPTSLSEAEEKTEIIVPPGRHLDHSSRENPTGLGDTTINLIKSLVTRKGLFNPENLARIFLEQVKGLDYFDYKASLLNYFSYSSKTTESQTNNGFLAQLRQKLKERFNQLYVEKESEIVSNELMLRTCNQVITWLTMEHNHSPSTIFTLFMSQEHYVLLALMFLKIILISPASRSHLDIHLAYLVNFYQQAYQDQEAEDSDWFGEFLDVVNVTMAIYTEGASYNIVESNSLVENYRIFSQIRSYDQSTGT